MEKPENVLRSMTTNRFQTAFKIKICNKASTSFFNTMLTRQILV